MARGLFESTKSEIGATIKLLETCGVVFLCASMFYHGSDHRLSLATLSKEKKFDWSTFGPRLFRVYIFYTKSKIGATIKLLETCSAGKP